MNYSNLSIIKGSSYEEVVVHFTVVVHLHNKEKKKQKVTYKWNYESVHLHIRGVCIFTNMAIWVAEPNATPNEMSCVQGITLV